MSDAASLYPLTPGFQNTDTSRQAAEDIESKADMLRKRCLAAVRSAPLGLTSLECADMFKEPHYNIHPRFSELRRGGLVKDSSERRTNRTSGKKAIVWVPGIDPAVFEDPKAVPTRPSARKTYVQGMEAAARAVEDENPEAAEEIRWAILRLPALEKKAVSRKKK